MGGGGAGNFFPFMIFLLLFSSTTLIMKGSYFNRVKIRYFPATRAGAGLGGGGKYPSPSWNFQNMHHGEQYLKIVDIIRGIFCMYILEFSSSRCSPIII